LPVKPLTGQKPASLIVKKFGFFEQVAGFQRSPLKSFRERHLWQRDFHPYSLCVRPEPYFRDASLPFLDCR
jgi:hypothetical protein